MVLASLASIDYSVRMMYKGIGPRSLLAAETTAIMQHISRNIQATVGDAVETAAGNSGILINNGSSQLAIRQDRNSPQTPSDYSDDEWVSYSLSADNNILFCNDNTGACGSLLTTLGSGKILSFTASFTEDSGPAALDNQINITIESCADPATCVAADIFTVSTTISVPSKGGPSI